MDSKHKRVNNNTNAVVELTLFSVHEKLVVHYGIMEGLW